MWGESPRYGGDLLGWAGSRILEATAGAHICIYAITLLSQACRFHVGRGHHLMSGLCSFLFAFIFLHFFFPCSYARVLASRSCWLDIPLFLVPDVQKANRKLGGKHIVICTVDCQTSDSDWLALDGGAPLWGISGVAALRLSWSFSLTAVAFREIYDPSILNIR